MWACGLEPLRQSSARFDIRDRTVKFAEQEMRGAPTLKKSGRHGAECLIDSQHDVFLYV